MKKLTTIEFIQKAKSIHGDKYDYSKVEYKNNKTKVCIICPRHGEFWQTPGNHIYKKTNCTFCANTLRKNQPHKGTNSLFIQKAKSIHGDKYDYSKVEYKNNHTKICIICPIHGEFWQTPSSHISGKGCYECGRIRTNQSLTCDSNKFIQNAKSIHGDKYDYSKVEYKNNKTKVCIICPRHGEFWQRPNDHLSNKGCPVCNSSQGELKVKQLLDEYKINYMQQYRFSDCRDKRTLPFDFYLPDHNLCIEYDGEQHFESVDVFGGKDALKRCQIHDKIKTKFCKSNNIKLVRIRYDENIGERLESEIQY